MRRGLAQAGIALAQAKRFPGWLSLLGVVALFVLRGPSPPG